jgi:hypothetical protein
MTSGSSKTSTGVPDIDCDFLALFVVLSPSALGPLRLPLEDCTSFLDIGVLSRDPSFRNSTGDTSLLVDLDSLAAVSEALVWFPALEECCGRV